MKWIEYDYVCNADKGINLHKKIEYSEGNLAIALAEACNGNYNITEDDEVLDTKPIAIENGGTGANTADQARENLGAANKEHTHSAQDIKSGSLLVVRGGTGASTAEGARKNLGITPVNIGALSLSGGAMKGAITTKGIKLTKDTDYGSTLPTSPAVGQLFFLDADVADELGL